MLRYLLALAAFAAPLLASAQTAVPPAVAKFEGEMATAICQDLEKENKTKPFDKLDKAQATSLFQAVMVRTFTARQAQAEKVMKANKMESQEAMQDFGKRVALRLAGECPTAMSLFVKLSGADASVNSADLAISEAERPLLESITAGTCTGLTASNAKQPLSGMSKADRTALMQQTMQGVMKEHAKELSAQYGPEVFFDTERLRALGMKVASLMATKCPSILTALSEQ